eukprot:TRINITY_DN20710_c0_g1_i4.p1 TRINITY_DN20710_c0_g1~~TRINITY_DN20710_c0_g1_i4.p1  ORF type:complete len:218 (+),score=44.00 TRINITY_DN20710_c0_g1_i4:79-732(+)
MSAVFNPSSLRDQLARIEQSLGVCHIAEVKTWQAPPAAPGAAGQPKSARKGGRTLRPDDSARMPLLGSTSVFDVPHGGDRSNSARDRGGLTTTVTEFMSELGAPAACPIKRPHVFKKLGEPSSPRMAPAYLPGDEPIVEVIAKMSAELTNARKLADALSTHCDGVQAWLPPDDALAECHEAAFSSLEASHQSLMEQARLLLAASQRQGPCATVAVAL